MSEFHTGGCACGALRYRVRDAPTVGQVCHCRFCQKRLASAFAVLAVFPEDAVEVTQGRPAEVEFRSDESGRWLRMSFCAKCGTQISHVSEVRPGARTIAGGTFDDPGWFTISRHIWTRSKLPWVSIPEGMTTYEQMPPIPGQAPAR